MIAVLGAGVAGLQVARRLKERGIPFLVLEKRDKAGGLSRTETRGAYSWDLGPHAFYSKDPERMAYFTDLPLSYRRHERDVRVCHHGPGGRIHEVGYPFENGLCDLPLAHKFECVAGYCWASWTKKRGEFRHLRHWIDAGLGRGIARHFMVPYNEKIWSLPLERISMALVSQKIEPERPWTVLRNSLFGGSVGRAYQARFIYPSSGGAGAVPEALAAGFRDRVRTGFEARRLEAHGRGWRILSAEGGEPVRADAVVSTLPLPDLLAAVPELALEGLRGEFHSNDTWFVAVGLKEGARLRRFASCQWVFFAGPELFYRVDLMHNFDPGRPPTLVAEITRKDAASGMGEAALCGRVLADLRACGILGSEEDVEFAQAGLERCTYPIPSLGLPKALAEAEERLARRRIRLVGRGGRWEYLNTDGAFRRADDLIREGLPSLLES